MRVKLYHPLRGTPTIVDLDRATRIEQEGNYIYVYYCTSNGEKMNRYMCRTEANAIEIVNRYLAGE